MAHGVLVLLLAGAACTGPDERGEPHTDAPPAAVPKEIPVSFVSASWPMVMTDLTKLAPYNENKGWPQHVMQRDYKRSLSTFGGDAGLFTARAHADAADLYRQGAMLSANAILSVYAGMPEATDPVGTAHLLAVAYALNGKLDEARAASKKLDGVEDPTTSWHAPWKAWLAGPAAWPPDLSALPLNLGEPTPGGWPEVEGLPHYKLPEQTAEQRLREMGDPGALVALAIWHDKAAHLAAKDQVKALETYSARYRLPAEGPVTDPVELPLEFLFGSDYVVPADGPFVAEVLGTKGSAAVDVWADRSLLAWFAKNATTDGVFDAVVANENGVQLRKLLVDAQAATTHDTVEGHHRVFADIAQVGTMRNLGLVGEVLVDREEGGKARLIARDLAVDATACPIGMMSLAAWDAANAFPMRALDIVNAQSKRYPSLDTARYAVDVLGIRAGRKQTPSGAGM